MWYEEQDHCSIYAYTHIRIYAYTHIRIYTYTHGEVIVIVIVIVIAILITNLSGSKGDAVPRGVSEIHVPVCV